MRPRWTVLFSVIQLVASDVRELFFSVDPRLILLFAIETAQLGGIDFSGGSKKRGIEGMQRRLLIKE
jgi:hypothetical protein